MGEVFKVINQSIDYRASSYKNVIHEDELKQVLLNTIEQNGKTIDVSSFDNLKTLHDIFFYILENRLLSVIDLNRIILENIRFNCSNIFFEKVPGHITDEDIKSGINKISSFYSLKNTPTNYHEDFSDSGYNLLDRISSKNLNELYFPVIDYDENSVHIMASVKFLDKDENSSLRVCIIYLDRKTGYTTFYVNGKVGGFKIKNDNNVSISSGTAFFKHIRTLINSFFSFDFVSYKNSCYINRAKMFNFCNKMNSLMIGDYSEELNASLSPILKRQIRKIFSEMNKMNSKVKLDTEKTEMLMKRIFSNYLGEFITTGYNERDLVKKAKEAGAVCYPTKISFRGQQLARGKATTRGRKFPLTFESIFYSLNTDIEIAGELDEFTLAWFDTDFFAERSELEVSQTTIKITEEIFSLTLKNSKYKNKGMTEHIEREIRNAIY